MNGKSASEGGLPPKRESASRCVCLQGGLPQRGFASKEGSVSKCPPMKGVCLQRVVCRIQGICLKGVVPQGGLSNPPVLTSSGSHSSSEYASYWNAMGKDLHKRSFQWLKNEDLTKTIYSDFKSTNALCRMYRVLTDRKTYCSKCLGVKYYIQRANQIKRRGDM